MTQLVVSDQLESLFANLSTQIQEADYSKTFDTLMPALAGQAAEMFGGQHDSNGVSWEPLKRSNVKTKGHPAILVETGTLMNSLVSLGGFGNIHQTAPRGLLFGTDDPKAMFHQTGTSRMPARPPVGISEEDIEKVCNRIADATVSALKG